MTQKYSTVPNKPTLLPLPEDEELAAPLRRVLEDLESVLHGPMLWESGALVAAAAILERTAYRLSDIEAKMVERRELLRQQRAYLMRKAKAFRDTVREVQSDG